MHESRTSAPPDTDLRRQNLRSQLAAILQVDFSEEARAGETDFPAAEPRTAAARDTCPPDLTEPPRPAAITPSDGAGTGQALQRDGEFVPLAPDDISKLRIAQAEVESLILKFLVNRQTAAGRDIAAQIGISFLVCEKLLHAMKADRLVAFKAAANLGDYVYELTEAGTHRGRKFAKTCGYFGAAPVCLDDYAASVAAQSLQNSEPSIENLRAAFADLILSDDIFERLGRAVVSGKGLFLHGPPGNGKTSIAERVTLAYGACIWVPRAISAWGEIIRVFDPSCHEEVPVPDVQAGAPPGFIDDEKIDHRWVRIRRPTIVVGGELVLNNLEITANPKTGIAESPLQLKSNCGTLVIDDFGRQQVPPAALLNRWIVPLEKRYDFLNLTSGRKIQVPFDQFIVFSTNLEPKDLVDEAFLRRIPYKIDICDPTEEQYRALFAELAARMSIEPAQQPLDFLIEKHYRSAGRPMRFCHPRDLLRQIKVYYDFLEQPARLTIDAIDAAATDYFSVL
jgi:hypothetical protein